MCLANRRVYDLPIEYYPDGMPLVRLPQNYNDIRGILLRPKSLAAFCAGVFFIQSLTELDGLSFVRLILPFVPGARQDRINLTGDGLFSAKSIARMLNEIDVRSVVVVDPHSPVSSSLIDRCEVIQPMPPGTYDAIICPDAGAERRASAVARHKRIPLVHAWKSRDVVTGKISGFGFDKSSLQPGARVLIVDDICDGGGTFVGLGRLLREHGAVPHLFVSHGIFSGDMAPLYECFDSITCTDSIVGPKPANVNVLPICENLLKGIQ